MFDQLDALKQTLDARRPLPEVTLQSLREKQMLDWTYNSNAIEGNTLTLQETKVVLEGITIGGKSLREHLEVRNHHEAINYVYDVLKGDIALSAFVITSIHQLVLQGIDNKIAGSYRDSNVIISGAQHTPPSHFVVSQQMDELVAWYHNYEGHPVERAAKLHVDFVGIHPFVDGNGRTARLLMNLDLLRSGYQPMIFQTRDRLAYYQALDKAHVSGDDTDFIKLVIDGAVASMQELLSLLD